MTTLLLKLITLLIKQKEENKRSINL